MIPYKTSRDYSRLKQLLDEGMGIVCFVAYITAWRAPDDPPIRDVCKAMKTGEGDYELFSRGVGYASYWSKYHKFTFEKLMEECNVEFIEPDKQI